MKQLFTLLIFLLAVQVKAQDKIITVDSDTIECKVMERGSDAVSYVLFSDLSGPAKTIKYTQIHKIIMQSGAETEFTALNKPKVRTINGVPEEEVKKQNDEYAYWNRHAFRLSYGMSMGLVYSGTDWNKDVFVSYSIGLTPRKYLKFTLGWGHSADLKRSLGWEYWGDYRTFSSSITYRYVWVNRPKLRVFSGLGIGYLDTEAMMSDLVFNPSPLDYKFGSKEQVVREFNEFYGYSGILPDIELIGLEYVFREHWLIGSKLGYSTSGMATLGIGYSF
ncbi:MAG: hypothetical protein EP332_07210 [Bacteroidetes bacterium]|nr:MAG: hypothetical protein EP332_07210 [Bacteroidota bacterium]